MSPNATADPTAFPETCARLSESDLLAVYSAAPARLTQALDGLSEEALRARPVPEKWSIQEIAIHLSDSELVGALRFRRVLSEDRPDLPSYDQDLFADNLSYRGQDAGFRRACLHGFRNLRETSGWLLERASPSDWRREGRHPDWGAMSLRRLVELYADHGERHVGQILALRRRIGRPIDLPPLPSDTSR